MKLQYFVMERFTSFLQVIRFELGSFGRHSAVNSRIGVDDERREDALRPSDGARYAPGVSAVGPALPRRLSSAPVHLLGSLSDAGFRSAHILRQPAGDRGVAWGGSGAALYTWASVEPSRGAPSRMRTRNGTGGSTPTSPRS